jgi:hypothetical protein
MPRYSEGFKNEWAFFINSKTDNVTYNTKCMRCTRDCKQSYRAKIVYCPSYEKIKEGKD